MRYWLAPQRPWLWLLLALLLYTLAGFLLAPWLVERQLVNLSAERADLTTTVDNIDINPYTLTVTVEGLDVTDSESAPLLALDRLFINFELVSIVRRAWSFDEFHIIGLAMALQRFSDGDTNVGVVARRWAATAEPEETAPQEESGLVRLVIADLLVDSAALSLVDDVPASRFTTRIDPLNFSMRHLSTLLDENGDQELTLSMDDGEFFTWSGTSSLNPLHSEGRMTLAGAYTELIHEYFRDQLPFDLVGGEVTAELNYRAGVVADGPLSLDITGIQFRAADSELWNRDSGELLVSLAEASLENGALRWPENTVSLDAVRLRGFAFHPVREQDGTINLVALMQEMMPEHEESVADEPPDAAGESEPWQISVAELALQDWRVVFEDRVPEQVADIELGLDATLIGISTVPDAEMRLDSSVDVSSGGALSLGGTLVARPALQFDGEVALDGLELGFLQPYIEPYARVSIDEGHLGAEGTVTVTTDSQRYRGSASINNLALTDRNENEALFGVDSLLINGIALEQTDALSLDIDEIRLESPYARVEIEEDGSTNVGRVLVSSATDDTGPDSASEETADEPGPGMAVAIDSVIVAGASADFADWSLPLPFSVMISELDGDISSLSTRSQQPARISAEGRVGEFGLVTIGGELLPMALLQQTQVDLLFSNIDMPPMSPYVIVFAGREIDDGRLDADLLYRIENEELNGDNVLVMRDLVLGDEIPHPDAADLPLGLAIALLKDRNGVINMAVPVSGDVNSPEFSLAGVIGQAVSNLLIDIVTSPFRFLAGLVGSDDEDLAVIEFAPGRSDVAPPQEQKLVNLAEALAQRPRLRLRVPPVYAQQVDEAALARLLLDRRIETRVSNSQSSQPDEMTAITHRIAILEELLLAEGLVVEGLVVEGLVVEKVPLASSASESNATDSEQPHTLTMLRLLHMAPAPETGEARLDEPAYENTLRSRLLAQQSVPREELDELARRRAEQVLAVITASRQELESQTSLAEMREVSASEEGQVGMTLEIETTD